MRIFRIVITPVRSQPLMTISFYIQAESEHEVEVGLVENFNEFQCKVTEVIVQSSFSQARKDSGLEG